MQVSVVIPCYKSAGTLDRLVERLVPVLTEHTREHEIVLVVDGSPDNTWEVASAIAAAWPTVRAMRLSRNYGQHNAILAGVRSVRYSTVVTMDDDLQHPPEEVPVLLAALGDDLDLVYGLPVDDEHGRFRNLASRSVKAMMTRSLGIENARSISAFRVFRTFLRDGFEGVHGPHASLDVALSWSTARVGTCEVRMDQRTEGRSNYSFRLLVRHAVNMLVGYSAAPLRLVGYLGVACGALGMALLVLILIGYYTHAITVPGFTTVASMIAIFSGAQMVALAIVGEYVGRVHASNLGRPTYVVRERTDAEAHPEISPEA